MSKWDGGIGRISIELLRLSVFLYKMLHLYERLQNHILPSCEMMLFIIENGQIFDHPNIGLVK